MKRFPLLVLALGIVIGCAPRVKVVSFDEVERPPSESIQIISDRSQIDRPYTEIALITADDRGSNKSEPELVQALKMRAKEIGADAIILAGGDQSDDGGVLVPAGGNVLWFESNKRTVRAIAIVYTE